MSKPKALDLRKSSTIPVDSEDEFPVILRKD